MFRTQAICKGHKEPNGNIVDHYMEAFTRADFSKYLGIRQGPHAQDSENDLLFQILECSKLVLQSHTCYMDIAITHSSKIDNKFV